MTQDIGVRLKDMAKVQQDPIALIKWFADELGLNFDVGSFIFTFGPTFQIPVAVLHEASRWHGFRDGGDLSDAELTSLLRPFLLRYANTENHEPDS